MSTELSINAIHQGGMRVLARSGEHEVLTDYPLPGAEPPVGLSSLQLLLASLASCSANGLGALLKRDGIVLERLEVRATGQRRESHPTVLESIHLAFELAGPDLDPARLERVLQVAETRICPVWVMLSASTPISRSVTLR